MYLKFYILFLTVLTVYFALASPIPKQTDAAVKRDTDNHSSTNNEVLKRGKALSVWVEFCEEGGVNCVGYIDPYNNKCFTIFGKKTYIRFHSQLLLDRNSFTLNTASLDYKNYCPKPALAAQTFTRPQTETLLKINEPGIKYYFTYPY